jgi:hypothetical protein
MVSKRNESAEERKALWKKVAELEEAHASSKSALDKGFSVLSRTQPFQLRNGLQFIQVLYVGALEVYLWFIRISLRMKTLEEYMVQSLNSFA